jgi:hypothetical protein
LEAFFTEMEDKLKTGQDLGLDWKQLAEVWELRNHESKFYTVNEVNGCIEIDPNHLLTAIDCPKESIQLFNTFIMDCKRIFKQLLLDANINSETNQLLAALKTAKRIETKKLKNKKYQCAFTKELNEISVQIFFYNTNVKAKNKEQEIQKSIPVIVCPRYLLWLQSMYVLKYITDNLSKNSEYAIRVAWEMIHPLQQV